MRWFVAALVVFALWLASAAAAPIARACSCSPPKVQGAWWPLAGAFVPRNARIWVMHARGPDQPRARIELHDATGALVPGDTSEVLLGEPSGLPGRVIVLTPRELLEPDSAYRFDVLEGEAAKLVVRVELHTNDEVDEQPPDVPLVASADVTDARDDRGDIPSCRDGLGLSVNVDGDGLIVWRAALGADHKAPAFDPDRLEGSLAGADEDRGAGPELSLGAPCAAPWNGEELTMQFASFDLAGNFSGWSERERFVAPESGRGDGCHVRGLGSRATPGLEPAALGACLPFVLLVLRRRFSGRARRAER